MKHLKVQVKMSSAVVHSNRLPHRFRIKKKEQNKTWLTCKSKKEWRSKEEKKGKLSRRKKLEPSRIDKKGKIWERNIDYNPLELSSMTSIRMTLSISRILKEIVSFHILKGILAWGSRSLILKRANLKVKRKINIMTTSFLRKILLILQPD